MSFPNSDKSLFAQVKKKLSGHGWDMLGTDVPLAYRLSSESEKVKPHHRVDSKATKAFEKDNQEENKDSDTKTTKINYELVTVGATAGPGLGYLRFDFEIEGKDGKSLSTFSGSVKTFNFGVGTDIGGTVSTGTLEGPYIHWHKDAVLEALDGKTVAGDGFTFAIGNGFSIFTELSVGDYKDPTYGYEVEGFGIGWEGFRGPLRIDKDSFKIVKKEAN